MSRYADIRCPPYERPSAPDVDATGRPLTILELAARASAVVNYYRSVVESGADYATTLRAARAVADVSELLATSIADSAATGSGRLS